jgi:hypothetical protein
MWQFLCHRGLVILCLLLVTSEFHLFGVAIAMLVVLILRITKV